MRCYINTYIYGAIYRHSHPAEALSVSISMPAVLAIARFHRFCEHTHAPLLVLGSQLQVLQ